VCDQTKILGHGPHKCFSTIAHNLQNPILEANASKDNRSCNIPHSTSITLTQRHKTTPISWPAACGLIIYP
jgi:hypothetical protein